MTVSLRMVFDFYLFYPAETCPIELKTVCSECVIRFILLVTVNAGAVDHSVSTFVIVLAEYDFSFVIVAFRDLETIGTVKLRDAVIMFEFIETDIVEKQAVGVVPPAEMTAVIR